MDATLPSTDAFPARRLALFLASLSAAAAIGGGAELMASPTGGRYLPPLELLTHSPFDTFLIPGLILAFLVGGTSASSALLLFRRSPWEADATILAGGMLTFWIVAEVGILREVHWLHAACGALGLALLILGLLAARAQGHLRHKWVILVTSTESIAYLIPMMTALLLTRSAAPDVWIAAGVVLAGFLEGAILGAGQAWAFPLPVRKSRFIALTALGAGGAWMSSFLIVSLLRWNTPGILEGVLAVAIGFVGVFGIGIAQWVELRRHSSWAHQWIAWSALAWGLALPLSFSVGPFIDEQTPLWVHVVLWPTAGVMMAYVLALVTWQGVRRMPPVVLRRTARPFPRARKRALWSRALTTTPMHS